MSFELPALPYAKDAPAPHISAETPNITTVNTTVHMSLTSTT